MIRNQRKTEHLSIAAKTADGPVETGFADIHLIHQAVPELDLASIDLSVSFLGKDLQCPVIINAVTGGTPQAHRINNFFAYLADKYGMAMAVGSQTVALEDPGLRDSFTVVRESCPDGVVLANVGAMSSTQYALQAVKMIEADALQLHLNVPQELAMQEGDRSFKGMIDQISRIVDACPVPVIVKEVGFGLSREAVVRLYAAGVTRVDIGGQGGTNFLAIENQRCGLFDDHLEEWGIPTAISLAEVKSLGLPIDIIASGGIRSAMDVARALALGADLIGISGWVLKVLLEHGIDVLDETIDQFLYHLKAIYLMTGSVNTSELQQIPVLIFGHTAEWLRMRGIDPGMWAARS